MQWVNPDSIAPPFSAYSQGVLTDGPQRWLHVSGQVGIRPDGTLEEGFEAQAEQALANVLAVLAEAGMSKDDIVKLDVFLTRPSDLKAWRAIRDRTLDGHLAASTLLIVAGLASPDWLLEVQAVAATRS